MWLMNKNAMRYPEVIPPKGKQSHHTNKIRYMKKHLLNKLQTLDIALPFLLPVNTKFFRAPSYYTVIKNPMDLATINLRVENRYYCGVDELIKDIKLIVSNSFTFNPAESSAFKCAKELDRLLQTVMEKLPTGDEIPYFNGNLEKVHLKYRCRNKLKELLLHTSQFEKIARNFFYDKWKPVGEQLENNLFTSIDALDDHISNILEQLHFKMQRIYETFVSQVDKPDSKICRYGNPEINEGVFTKFGSNLWLTHKPQFNWNNTVIGALDFTIDNLIEDLVECIPIDAVGDDALELERLIQKKKELEEEILRELMDEGVDKDEEMKTSQSNEANVKDTKQIEKGEETDKRNQIENVKNNPVGEGNEDVSNSKGDDKEDHEYNADIYVKTMIERKLKERQDLGKEDEKSQSEDQKNKEQLKPCYSKALLQVLIRALIINNTRFANLFVDESSSDDAESSSDDDDSDDESSDDDNEDLNADSSNMVGVSDLKYHKNNNIDQKLNVMNIFPDSKDTLNRVKTTKQLDQQDYLRAKRHQEMNNVSGQGQGIRCSDVASFRFPTENKISNLNGPPASKCFRAERSTHIRSHIDNTQPKASKCKQKLPHSHC